MGNDTPLVGTNSVPIQRMRMATSATVLTAACLVAIAAVSACSKDNEAEARPRRTTTTEPEATTTTLDPIDAEKQAVIAAYNAAVQARRDAAAPPTPNPDLPALAETHTGYMYDYMVATVSGLRDGGTATRPPESSQSRVEVDSVIVQDVEGERVAFLEVCIVDDYEEIVLATGLPISNGVFTVQWTEAMKQVDGSWKVAEQRQNIRLEGVTGCAVD